MVVGLMAIRRATDRNGAEIVKYRSDEWLPIPEGPLPDKVIGFEQITISYIEQSVIEFLQRIRRLFGFSGTNVWIHTSAYQSRSWEIICQMIWPLVSDNICCLHLDSSQLERLRQFSPAILRNCANLRSIVTFDFSPVFPAEDNAGASSNQALVKWLLTSREDGLPKMLHCGSLLAKMEELKGSFVSASEPANFIIRMYHSPFAGIKPFELKNNWTAEQLTFRLIGGFWLLVRCPIGREENKWAKWEKEAIELPWCWWSRQWNRIAIDFGDSDIGDGMVEAKAGPSEPNKPKK
uniref:GRAS domain-containing protein n=1 Tax=Globodera pallida TaxID=36090 RepID=A0A183C5U3_GLOPA